jgi:hypothetical protein
MGRHRHQRLIVGLIIGLPIVLGVAFPAVAWQVAGSPRFWEHDATWVAHGPELHRGTKVKVTGGAQEPLRPGMTTPIVLTAKNPNSHRVWMNRIRVRIAGIDAPYADAAHPCTTADFKVHQMPRRTMSLPGRQSSDLRALGVPQELMPTLTMLYRPVNQDGCKNAQVRLSFKARGLHG